MKLEEKAMSQEFSMTNFFREAKELFKVSSALAIMSLAAPVLAGSMSMTEQAKQIVKEASAPLSNGADARAIYVGQKLAGRSIFYISAGLSFEFSQEVLKGVEDASNKLGMRIITADAPDSSQASASIDRAISRHASAIVLQGIDPYTVQAAITDAKKAGIPVVSTAAIPAGPIPKNIADAGLSANVNISIVDTGKITAAYIAANGRPDAQVALISCSTFESDSVFAKEFTKELKRLCPECQVIQKDSPLPQWQTTLPSLVRTLVTVNPKMSYVVASVDSMVPSIKPAIIAVGAGDRIKIVSSNASLPDMQAIALKTDTEVANLGASNERMGWATVDQVARLLIGQPAIDNVEPQRLFTIDNIGTVNLTKPAATWYGFDFQSYYLKLWGLKS
ncbi:substrate-binding domain-containing protein [Paraburkholderia sp. 1N]|uniref:Substrate-binding domain-containing protein n=1 Tax=Paraburkholderia solitsugae TaxID=2675748 RepID=A0ABX2BXU6_9BURK|nr:substrate-binding domain-containing protein [Paraburkholderia solitsugae]NPT44838.1 substrate-binding domain-containing protein [Paraburkholderia solitsugae]